MTDQHLVSTTEHLDSHLRTVTVELSTPSITHEWLHNGAIFRTTLHDNSRHTVDQYITRWLEILSNAQAGQTMLFIFDVSKISFTTYGRTRSLELTRFRKDIKGFVGIVEKNNIEAHFTGMIVRTMDRDTSNVRLRMVYSMDEAIQWVMQMGQFSKPSAE